MHTPVSESDDEQPWGAIAGPRTIDTIVESFIREHGRDALRRELPGIVNWVSAGVRAGKLSSAHGRDLIHTIARKVAT